ncbi:MAG: hypothetical protein M3362_01550 [Acidobacteriota bacterium]|nr:hypothetical protein [Acidobacteriota bacterium]
MPVSRSKGKQRKKRVRTPPSVAAAVNNTEPWDIVAQIEALILIRTGLIAIIIALVNSVILAVFYIPAMDSPAVNRLPYYAKFGYAHFAAAINIITIILTSVVKKIDTKKKEGRKRARKFIRWMVVLSIFSLALSIFPSLYVSGFTDKAASLISQYFPELSTKAKEVASYLITALLSGVIGNFAYDILKRIVLNRAKSRIEQESDEGGSPKVELFK